MSCKPTPKSSFCRGRSLDISSIVRMTQKTEMVLLVISEGILKESQSLNSRSAQPSSKIFKTEKNIMVPNTIAIYCQLLYCQLLYLHMPCGAKAGHMSNQFKSSQFPMILRHAWIPAAATRPRWRSVGAGSHPPGHGNQQGILRPLKIHRRILTDMLHSFLHLYIFIHIYTYIHIFDIIQ